MTREECIDGMQRIIDEDQNKILVRVHVGYLIHAVKYLKDQPDVIRCKDCRRNHQCAIQFKFADADDEENWFCADGKRI